MGITKHLHVHALEISRQQSVVKETSSRLANLALEIAIPECRHWRAREDSHKKHDDGVDGNVPENDISGDLEASCGEDVQIEHDQ